jgi:hypothetical protein
MRTSWLATVRPDSWAVLVVGATGLVLFAVQVEDRTPMLLYFTIWSAILSTIVWPLLDATGTGAVRIAARAGAAGSLLAGLVYWANLFPTYGAGKYLVTVLANVFLHALLPVVVLVRLIRGTERLSLTEELATIAWPVLYPLFSVVLALSGTPSPYAFLRPDTGANLWLNVPAFMAIWYAIAFAVHGVLWLVKRPAPASH